MADMQPAWLYSILAAVFVLAAGFIGASLRGGSRLQRRLFLLFLLLSFVPVSAVLLINWNMSQRQLDFLQSPGLQGSLESSLELARLTLEGERSLARAAAEDLAARLALEGAPALPPGCGYCLIDSAGRPLDGAGGVAIPPGSFAGLDPARAGVPWRSSWGAGDYLLAVAPAGGRSPGWLLFARPLDEQLAACLDAVTLGSSRYRQLRLVDTLLRGDVLLTLSALGLLVLGLSLVLARRLARQIGGPLRELARGTEQVAAGDLGRQLSVHAVDELGDLVAAFNRMTRELMKSKEELLRAERVAAWQGIARRLAHEIKNPLTPIGLSMHRIRRKVADPTVGECIDAVLEETANLQRLADEFAAYARLPAPVKEEVDVGDLLRGVLELYASRSRVTVRWDPWRTGARIMADAGQLRQVFSNLVKNAVEAMSGGGILTLGMRLGDDGLEIRLRDTGPGLPASPEEIFAPSFTTKESGTGLGLAIARKIVADHGGRLEAAAVPDGAEFSVYLPDLISGGVAAPGGET